MVALAAVPFVPRAIFYMAYVVFVAALIWSLGAWLSSPYLAKTNPRNWSKKKKQASNLKMARAQYHATKWSALIGIVSIFCICMYFTYDIQIAKELAELHGLLIPANDPYISGCEKTPSGLTINLGKLALMTDVFPFPVIAADEAGKEDSKQILISLDKDSRGNLLVSSDVFDQDGKLIARISKNEFSVDEPSIFRTYKERPDRSTLVLTDHYGKRVLYVRFLNRSLVKILGTLFVSGNDLPVAKGVGVIIDDENGFRTVGLDSGLSWGQGCIHGSRGGVLLNVHSSKSGP